MTPLGRMKDGGRRNVVTMAECCNANRWQPWADRQRADGITLSIMGQRDEDTAHPLAPDGSERQGMEIWQPLSVWSDTDVWAYIKAHGLPVSAHYARGGARQMHSPECARCPAS
ncbi:phosphoadenosine phosphosulfate reductase domain-containing protein [Reyranella soli]